MTQGQQIALFISLFLAFIGIIFFFFGIISLKKTIPLKKKCTETTNAKIVKITEEYTHNDTRRLYATLKYQAKGNTVTSKIPISYDIFHKPKEGQTIKIKYNPKARSQCYIYGEDPNGSSAGFLAVGGALIIGAIIILITQL